MGKQFPIYHKLPINLKKENKMTTITTELKQYTVQYSNGTSKLSVQIMGNSEGMIEDVFYETYGENMDIISITLD
jgi:hypothetical protein